jgi:hypothetical protein
VSSILEQKKRVEGTPPQLGITLWSHLSSSFKRACFAKMAIRDLLGQVITLLMLVSGCIALLPTTSINEWHLD